MIHVPITAKPAQQSATTTTTTPVAYVLSGSDLAALLPTCTPNNPNPAPAASSETVSVLAAPPITLIGPSVYGYCPSIVPYQCVTTIHNNSQATPTPAPQKQPAAASSSLTRSQEKEIADLVSLRVKEHISRYEAEMQSKRREKKDERSRSRSGSPSRSRSKSRSCSRSRSASRPNSGNNCCTQCCRNCNCCNNMTTVTRERFTISDKRCSTPPPPSTNFLPRPHTFLGQEMSLDEKIRRIREELNLPHDPEERVWRPGSSDNRCKMCNCDVTKKWKKINVLDAGRQAVARARSKSAELARRRSASARSYKSRSPTSRPPWIPTGLNDYSNTHSERARLLQDSWLRRECTSTDLLTRRNSMPCADLLVDQLAPCRTMAYVQQQPAKTTITTTVDTYKTQQPSQYYYQQPVQQYFTTSTRLPPLVNAAACSRPQTPVADYCYGSTKYNPGSREYLHYYYPKQQSSSVYHNSCTSAANRQPYVYDRAHSGGGCNAQSRPLCTRLKPLDVTPKGALYTCAQHKNDVHYVSDNAGRDLSKGSHVRVSTAGTTYIHE